jgi:hypothetical protein
MNLDDITGEAIAEASFKKDKEFEYFVRELLLHELAERHRGSARVKGPMKRYVGDDQQDLVFVVEHAPTLERADYRYALTWDDVGETWYSCKGGTKWSDSIKDELGRRAYHAYQKKGHVPSKRQKRASREVLDHLVQGGRYVFVVSGQLTNERPFLDQITEILRFWMQQDGLQEPENLRDQLFLIDANAIADFIKSNRPPLSEKVRTALGAIEPASIMSWAQWQPILAPGREPPRFEADALRREIIAAVLDDSIRVMRIHGPPGTGKTRLAHEALARWDEAGARVRYCRDSASLSVSNELSRWLPSVGLITLVVDEVVTQEVHRLVSDFRAYADPSARLILIGTTDAEAGAVRSTAIDRSFALLPLPDEHTRTLVEREFEDASVKPDQRVDRILQLSEGYPLFAVKLAEALARDGEALATGDDETNSWSAAQRVLVGPRTGHDWEEASELRARCLLIVVLTADYQGTWEQLWGDHGSALAKAVDRGADDLRRAAGACRERELLRDLGFRRYVSPANLVRILLNRLLAPPPGPDLGPGLFQHTPEFAPTVLAVARRVDVRPDLLRRVSVLAWREFDRLIDEGEAPRPHAMREAGEEAPDIAARSLARLSDEHLFGLTESARQSLASLLVHLTRRRIDEVAFAHVEQLLARLVPLDDASGSLRMHWHALFLPALHPTHQSWECRFGLLESHARSTDPRERRLVAAAMKRILQPHEIGPVYSERDMRDGDWLRMSPGEIVEASSQLWSLMIDLSSDSDAEVVTLARAAIARLPSRGLQIPHVERLVNTVDGWRPAQRLALRERLDEVLRFHEDDFVRWPAMGEALSALRSALEPTDLLGEIVAQVGTRRPIPLLVGVDYQDWRRRLGDRDRELARRLLERPEQLDDILTWLESDEAVRAWYFMVEYGALDDERSSLHSLERHARDTSAERLLAAYLTGWGQRAPTDPALDEWLEAAIDGEFAKHAAFALAHYPATTRRFALLERLVELGHGTPELLRAFVERRWTSGQPVTAQLRLLDRLVACAQAPTSSIEIAVDLLRSTSLEPAQRGQALTLLEVALAQATRERVPMIAQDAWQAGARLLADAGKVDVVARQVLAMVNEGPGNDGLAERTLQELLEAGYGLVLWAQFRDELLEDRREGLLHHLAQIGFLRYVDHTEVFEWIGKDSARARAVVALINPYQAGLDDLATMLLERFGPTSAVADRLLVRALTRPSADWVGSLDFERRQLHNAEVWVDTGSAAVRGWAGRVVDHLERTLARYDESMRKLA